MRVLEQLEPQGVFRFFEELCAIPHGSRNCQAVSDWCAAFARERGLECHQDQAGNVIIIQEATPGYEAAAPVILQGHLDMVCERARLHQGHGRRGPGPAGGGRLRPGEGHHPGRR